MISTNSSDCTSTPSFSLQLSAEMQGNRPFIVDDMFWDGDPDVGFVDTATMRWTFFRSESNYVWPSWPLTGPLQHGTADAQPL
jgi:hypothetical protein